MAVITRRKPQEPALPPEGGRAVSVAEERGFEQVCLPPIKRRANMAKSSVLCMVILARQNNHTGGFIRFLRGYLPVRTLASESTRGKKTIARNLQ